VDASHVDGCARRTPSRRVDFAPADRPEPSWTLDALDAKSGVRDCATWPTIDVVRDRAAVPFPAGVTRDLDPSGQLARWGHSGH
jgi:hypothetical protein